MRPSQSLSTPSHTSTPPVQPPGQAISHPSLASLFLSEKPKSHVAITQAAFEQVAEACESVVQFRLQAPQCWGSLMKPAAGTSSTEPLQSLSMPSQISTPLFVLAHSQPSAATLLASTKPSLHAPSAQALAAHDAAALRNAQRCPHAPQFSTSTSRCVSSSTSLSQSLSI